MWAAEAGPSSVLRVPEPPTWAAEAGPSLGRRRDNSRADFRLSYKACTSDVISLTDRLASPNSSEVLGS
jgi:hypothetical protein